MRHKHDAIVKQSISMGRLDNKWSSCFHFTLRQFLLHLQNA